MRFFSLLTAASRKLPRIVPLMRDPLVPLYLKIGAAVLALLIVLPFDILSDIPVLGLFDDATLLLFLVSGFVAVAERARQRALPRLP